MLELRDVPDPDAGHGQVRVRVRASAVNRADLLQRMGAYPAPPGAPPDVPGLEIAGEVEAVGPGVTELREGDRVFGVVAGGGYADKIVVHARTVALMPRGLSFADAAAIPEAFVTAYDAMVAQARLTAGEDVLVHAAGSGVGTAAIQIARAIGARPIGTARSQEKLDRARELGLALGVVAKEGRFADAVRSLTAGRGVDVVLDLVGGGYVAESLSAMAERGRLVLVGLMAGTRADVDLGLVLRRRLSVVGTVLRARPLEEKIVATQLLARNLAPLVESGALRAVVDAVLPLESAREAHERMAKNETFGKIVLSCE